VGRCDQKRLLVVTRGSECQRHRSILAPRPLDRREQKRSVVLVGGQRFHEPEKTVHRGGGCFDEPPEGEGPVAFDDMIANRFGIRIDDDDDLGCARFCHGMEDVFDQRRAADSRQRF